MEETGIESEIEGKRGGKKERDGFLQVAGFEERENGVGNGFGLGG